MAAGRRRFRAIEQCATEGRSRQSVAADLDGTLLLSRSAFPYYLLIALEAGSLLRAAALLASVPFVYLTYVSFSEPLAVRAMLYVAVAGLRVKDIERVARTVLPRCIVTASPRVMVEPFAREFLGADVVIGTELEVDDQSGRATGFVAEPGVLVSDHKRRAVVREFGDKLPDVGMGDRESDFDFMSICKEAYMVTRKQYRAAPRDQLQSRAVLHDGRLVRRPTDINTLLTFLWLPLGLTLAFLRVHVTRHLPPRAVSFAYKLLGVKLVVRGHPPPPPSPKNGHLFVCNHRTVLDPAMLAAALGCKVTCATYDSDDDSIITSSAPLVALSGDRDADAARVGRLLDEGHDVVVFPEGATSRDAFLLRFGARFAGLTDRIVPVAVDARESMFHGSSAARWREDPYLFFMNPRPAYEVTFLNRLPRELTCGGGRAPGEVAGYVQRILAAQLGFECTSITRKDKYRVLLTGSDRHLVSLKG
ncbi:hypothetical protein PR202_gb01407 [Eleusine coracana subsp. coracana]|uniref:Phospholipid/glycerol acyltransferase domain-containing protein n=1 Tax=Eleusine coracana subsp. coracana TaxID=191504 RepID=A0AAV5DU41_ELECO|nr:hypothetical protein PR202_gb01407 [Eleusine coracana subsp. coracana]